MVPSIGAVVLLALIAAVAYGIGKAVRARSRSMPSPMSMTSGQASPPAPGWLDDRLRVWLADGLLTATQVDAIRDREQRLSETRAASPATPLNAPQRALAGQSARRSVAAEALGYIGGALAMTGVVLVVARSWADLGVVARLSVSGVGAVVLTGGGALVPRAGREPAMGRLRTALWLLSSAAFAVVAVVIVRDIVHTRNPATIVLGATAAAAVQSATLWWGRAVPLQQASCLASTLGAVGAATMENGSHGATGVVVLVAGLAMLVAGAAHLTTAPVVTASVGAAGTVVGGMFIANRWQGAGLIVLWATSTTLIALGISRRRGLRTPAERAGVAIIGAIAAAGTIPSGLGWFSREAAIATGAALALLGVVAAFVASRGLVLLARAVELAGGLAIVGGVALMGSQSVALATLLGVATGAVLVGVGMRPGRVLTSVVGLAALLVNVPWAIAWFFPGEGRAPLLLAVSGALIIAVAIALSHMGGRFRELRHHGTA